MKIASFPDVVFIICFENAYIVLGTVDDFAEIYES